MTEDQDASQTTHLAPPTLSPPLGEREFSHGKGGRRKMSRESRQDGLKEEQINKIISMIST